MTGERIMTSDTALMDAVARFAGQDVVAFRNEWNAANTPPAETKEKQEAFSHVQKQANPKNLLAGGISVKVKMNYLSLSGEPKDRPVVIRRVFKNGSHIFIDALCLDINAPRLIKLENIKQITDVASENVYVNVSQFFEQVLGIDLNELPLSQQKPAMPQNNKDMSRSSTLTGSGSEMKTAIERARYEITALLYISGIDGQRDERELQKVVEYVHKRCPDLSFTDEALMQYLKMNYPDTQSFYYALERILGKEGWVVKMFLEKLMELIVADGKTDEKEKLFLADFLSILQDEGFELNFKNS